MRAEAEHTDPVLESWGLTHRKVLCSPAAKWLKMMSLDCRPACSRWFGRGGPSFENPFVLAEESPDAAARGRKARPSRADGPRVGLRRPSATHSNGLSRCNQGAISLVLEKVKRSLCFPPYSGFRGLKPNVSVRLCVQSVRFQTGHFNA